MTARRALLVGIDAYPNIRQLDGCVNDSRLVRQVLAERFEFPDANITQLLDAQATRDAILGAFDALAAATGPDDIVVVHYAGHGSQMRDREGDEPSGFDSTLMPWDTGREPHENRDITDDEIHEKLAAIAARTPHVTILVDACHSGTVTRDAFGAKTRAVEPDLRPVSALPPSSIVRREAPRTRSGAGGWLPLADRHVLIAGCRDDEEAKEYFPPEGGGPHGALTYFLCQHLRQATARTTYRDVFETVAARVTAYNAVQHPQIEGTADKVFFGVDTLPPATFATVTSRTGRTIGLAAGQALGVTVGSTYAVHPGGTKAHDAATALGEAVVRAITPFTAEAEITREPAPGAIAAGARAFEIAHAFGDNRLPVHCAGPEAGAAFGDALRASSLLAAAPDGAVAAARVYLLGPRGSVSPDSPVPQAGPLDAERWAVVDATGALLMPLKARDDAATVVQNLEKVARADRVRALDNPAPGPLKDAVTLEIRRKASAGGYVPATPDAQGGLPVVDEGQRVQFRITNHHDRSLFVAVVYIGTGSEISPPVHLTLAGGVTDSSVSGPVSFPANYPFVDLGDPLRGVDSVETVKLIVTEEKVDFSGLAQAAVRSAAIGAPATPFAASLQQMAGAGTRGFTAEPEPEGVAPASAKAWATVSRSLLLRRRSAVLSEGPAPVAVGQAVLSAPDLTGTVTTARTAEGHDPAAGFATTALTEALASADVAMKQTLEISGARQTGAATRGAVAPAPIEVQLAPPPEGYGQMVLASDELGVVSWSFAEATPASRSLDGRSQARSYRIRSDVPVEAPEPGSRGVIALAGRKVIKELLFPIVRPMLGAAGASVVNWLETTRWPYRVRAFTPDNYTAPDAPILDRDAWRTLGAGRALLMVHGTFSRTHLAFAAMPKDYIEALHRQYEGRVFAFDHLFLSEDPAANVRWLVSQMPEDADLTLDIVCHSRGGLVSRVLAEKQGELSLGGRRIRVGTIVLVGVPNAGTPLADPSHVGTLLDSFTNVINFVPDAWGAPVLAMIVEVAKLAAIGALDGLVGLRSMHPTGDFAKWLNAPGPVDGTRYHAVASNVSPAEPGLRHFLRSRALTAILKGGNDLVVPSEGAYAANGSPRFPVADPMLLEGDGSVPHTKYFAEARVRDQILAWLGDR